MDFVSADLLAEMCARMDDASIEALYLSPIGGAVAEVIRRQYFWYLRTEHLMERRFVFRRGDWKQAYYTLRDWKKDPENDQTFGNLLACHVLLDVGYIPTSRDLEDACYSGNADVVALLLDDGRADPAEGNSFILKIPAAIEGDVEILRLLLEDGRADPTATNPNPPRRTTLAVACQAANLAGVRLLLADPRVDPTQEQTVTMQSVFRNSDNREKRTQILRLLLAYPEMDPSPALAEAAGFGYEDVVALLLADKRTDPGHANEFYIWNTLNRGQVGVLRLLISDPRVAPRVTTQQNLLQVIGYDNAELLSVLLYEAGMAPTIDDFVTAIQYNSPACLRVLLDDGRVDPSQDNNGLLQWALDARDNIDGPDALEVLEADPRVIAGAPVER